MSSYWGIIAGPDPAHPEDTDAEGWEWTLKHSKAVRSAGSGAS